MTHRSGSEGRSLQHEGAGPGKEAVLLALPAVGDPAPYAQPLPGYRHRLSCFGWARPMSWHATAQSCVAGWLRVVRGGAGCVGRGAGRGWCA